MTSTVTNTSTEDVSAAHVGAFFLDSKGRPIGFSYTSLVENLRAGKTMGLGVTDAASRSRSAHHISRRHHSRDGRASLGFLVVLGVVALYAAKGVPIPGIPPVVRIAVVVIALAPAAVTGVAGVGRGYGFGPMPGFRWMLDPAPSLTIDADDLSLSIGGQDQWAVPWASVDRLAAIGRPERLAIFRRNDPHALVIPGELLGGRVMGADVIVDVVGLITTVLSDARVPGSTRPFP